MILDVARMMYRYNTWANARILDAATRLTPAQLVAPGGASFDSVRDTLAHTLNGSARGIGAWRVARAAEALELAVCAGPDAVARALDQLAGAADEARAVIAELLLPN